MGRVCNTPQTWNNKLPPSWLMFFVNMLKNSSSKLSKTIVRIDFERPCNNHYGRVIHTSRTVCRFVFNNSIIIPRENAELRENDGDMACFLYTSARLVHVRIAYMHMCIS